MTRDRNPAAHGEISSRQARTRVGDLSPARRTLLEKRLRERRWSDDTVIEKRPGDIPFAPITYGQRALWYLDQLNPDSAAYVVFRVWLITGHLDRGALEWSITEIVRRHEALRSCVRFVDEEPVQVVRVPHDDNLEFLDLHEESIEVREKYCRDLVSKHWSSPIRLTDWNLFHAHLIQVDDTEHVLFIRLHHAFCDGWSIGLFVRELGHLYKCRVTGTEPALPALPIRYGDYAWWQRNRASELIGDDVEYWTKQLVGVPKLLELPTDRKRPAIQRHRGRRHFIRLPTTMVERLDGFARQRGATPFMVLLAIYKLVLCRFSGQNDVCVGVPHASRNRPELENLIGLIVNTVVLRSRIDLEDSFDTYLKSIRETTIQSFEHAAAPVDLLVEKLGVSTALDHNPLFQTMFVLQTGVQHSLDLHGLKVENANVGATGTFSQGNWTSKFDLSLTLIPVDEGLDGVLEYDTDLFESDSIERISDAFLLLLESAMDDSSRALCHLRVMRDEQCQRIVNDWNDTYRVREDESVVSRFESLAARQGNKVALRCGDRDVSYCVLKETADHVARCLLDAGVKRWDRVGLCLEPSMQLTTSMLGILRCGALFVPLDPSLPATRLQALVSDAGINQVLVDETTAHMFDSLAVGLIHPRAPSTELAVLPDIEQHAGDPAYVLFTSGSTGRPKGVVGTHQGLLNRIDWMQDEFPFGEDECCCHRTSLGFVDGIAEIFTPLLCGVPAVVLTQEERSTPAALTHALFRYNITRLTLAPTLLKALLNQNGGIACLKSLKCCISSGETLPASLWEQFQEQLPDAALLNLYGSTEIAADATWFDCRNAVPGGPIPIGRPIHNTRVYVVDEFMHPQPVGVAGNLLVSGIGLAKGYWNDPELTTAKFFPDPFNEGETIYATGDLARFLTDGNLEYLGRTDDQIKLHGIRIEPRDIEAVLTLHPAVESAVVALSYHRDRGQQLAAWIVYKAGEHPDVTALRAYLSEHLPQQWIPSLYVELQELPLLSSGKIDRQALPAPGDWRPEVTSPYKAPVTIVEKKLATIWERILGVNQIGRNDNFFDLGGHSILVFELLQTVQDEFGSELPMSHVFLCPTVSALAARIENDSAANNRAPVVVSIRSDGHSIPFFCIPAAAQSVYSVRSIAAEFRDDQSLFAIQPLGFDEGTDAQDSIPQMAKTYIKAIRDRQPTGAYYLGGRCFGGLVAVEMVRQLQAEGETIGLLILLDTVVPSFRASQLLKQCDVSSRFGLLIKYPFERILSRILRRRLTLETDKQLDSLSSNQALRIRVVDKAHRRALNAYTLAPITAPVVWIRACTPFRALRYGWAPFVKGDFSCIDVVGDHFSMFEPPHVSTLSRRLSEILIEAQSPRMGSKNASKVENVTTHPVSRPSMETRDQVLVGQELQTSGEPAVRQWFSNHASQDRTE